MENSCILFDVNETVLDLSVLKPLFAKTFGSELHLSIWFNSLLHSSTVCALTDQKNDFATLARATLQSLASRHGLNLSEEDQTAILTQLASLPAHTDVIPAIQELTAHGYDCIAFSNSSHSLIAKQISNAGLDGHFKECLSVEATGSFKPDPRVYAQAAKSLNRPAAALRLIACHDWDTHGAMNAGFKAAYIERTGAGYNPAYVKPSVEDSSLTALAQKIIAEDRAKPETYS